jgi:hypothetical protein
MPSKMRAGIRIEAEGTLPIGVGEGAIKRITTGDRITTITGTKIPMVAKIILMEEAVVVGAGVAEGTVGITTAAMDTLQSSGAVARLSKNLQSRHHLPKSHQTRPLKSNKHLP